MACFSRFCKPAMIFWGTPGPLRAAFSVKKAQSVINRVLACLAVFERVSAQLETRLNANAKVKAKKGKFFPLLPLVLSPLRPATSRSQHSFLKFYTVKF
jgi:hypothetical protein